MLEVRKTHHTHPPAKETVHSFPNFKSLSRFSLRVLPQPKNNVFFRPYFRSSVLTSVRQRPFSGAKITFVLHSVSEPAPHTSRAGVHVGGHVSLWLSIPLHPGPLICAPLGFGRSESEITSGGFIFGLGKGIGKSHFHPWESPPTPLSCWGSGRGDWSLWFSIPPPSSWGGNKGRSHVEISLSNKTRGLEHLQLLRARTERGRGPHWFCFFKYFCQFFSRFSNLTSGVSFPCSRAPTKLEDVDHFFFGSR